MTENKNYKAYIFLFFAICIINLFTNCFSPLYRPEGNLDPAAFYMEGRAWAHGYLPYKDFIDVKGIFLFFIYWVGYILSPDCTWGIFVIYIIFSSFFAIYLYKICQIFNLRAYHALVISIICLAFQYNVTTAYWGAQPELIINAFLSWGLYHVINHLEKELKTSDFIYSGISVGIGFAATFLIKYNVCIVYLAYFAIHLTILVRKGNERKDLILFIISALSSSLLFFLPFFVYMSQMGIMSHFTHCYFNLNAHAYSSEYSTSVAGNIAYRLNNIIKGPGLIPTILTFASCSIFLSNCICNKKHTFNNIAYVILIICFYAICFVGRWGYYYIMFAPIIVIFAIRLTLNGKNKLVNILKAIIFSKHRYITLISLVACCILCNMHPFRNRGLWRTDTNQLVRIETEMAKITHPTIIYYRTVDFGLGMKASPLPAIPAWSHFLSVHKDEQRHAIERKIPDFIYTDIKHSDFLIKSGYFPILGTQINSKLLFRKADINNKRSPLQFGFDEGCGG